MLFKIHKEGYVILKIIFIIIIITLAIFFYFFSKQLFITAIFLFTIIYIFILWFFRNPYRNYSINEHEVIAPVDGKVISVKTTFEHEFLKKICIQISIFMSPLNVHVTRYPITGKVIYSKYHPGKYFFAWQNKSSSKNEHTTVAILTKSKDIIVFRQIAGFLARRIVLYAEIGDKAETGKEFGFIKFGSRLDVFLPLNFDILVKVGQKTIGAKTIIAKLNITKLVTNLH